MLHYNISKKINTRYAKNLWKNATSSNQKEQFYLLFALCNRRDFSCCHWNENRKENNEVSKYANALILDLEKDIEMINVIIYSANQISYRIDSLSNYIRNTQLEDISNLTLLSLTWIRVYRPYMWNRATLDGLKGSGSLSLFKNKGLSKKIVEYDAFTKHMDEDYHTDDIQANNALQLLSSVVNNNYQNIKELSELFRVSTNSGELADVYSSPIYMESEEYDLSLITNDINAVNHAVNSYIRLQFNLRIRTQVELPQMIQDAKDLIELLKKESKLSTSDQDKFDDLDKSESVKEEIKYL
ncbi:MAG: hypothetical protein DRI70_07375 [Bacteroidetes bacterium]|nr:MAG: hypothetical protein DRI70_07375 [Bacteroidota bacterium]